MQVISSLAELELKIAECNDVLARQSDDAMRHLFATFRMDFSDQAPEDPFSDAYHAFQMAIYRTVAGRPYRVENERSNFDTAARAACPFPYYLRSAWTAGHHLLAIGFMLTRLNLPPGARILEFGPGWGNTTIELARLGFDVTAIDIDTNFCDVIRTRAAQLDVPVQVIEGEFFLAESLGRRFEAVLFFECFHHCSDHLRLLRALHRVVVPGGRVFLAAEPIAEDYGIPWGVRMDGEALWAARSFGWLELGFDEDYFRLALQRTGWRGTRHLCATLPWASVWELERLDDLAPDTTASEPRPDVAEPEAIAPSPAAEAATLSSSAATRDAERARRELEAVYASTSWRLTQPIRFMKRLMLSSS